MEIIGDLLRRKTRGCLGDEDPIRSSTSSNQLVESTGVVESEDSNTERGDQDDYGDEGDEGGDEPEVPPSILRNNVR